MARQKIDYTSLEEWRRDRKLTIVRMAEIAKRRGVTVSANTLGTAFREGLPLHGRVLLAWEEAFGWTRQETLWLCMGGPPVQLTNLNTRKACASSIRAETAYLTIDQEYLIEKITQGILDGIASALEKGAKGAGDK
ncbi:MAG: hypothetical protein ACOX4A_00135 [Saccharofermentanales bacterium]|jgi:hypothetical protein